MARPFDVTQTLSMLAGSLNFLAAYNRDLFPSLLMSNNLTMRTFHKSDKDKLRNKTPWNCTSAETQILVAKACYAASEVQNDVRWLTIANNTTRTFLDYFFIDYTPSPILANTDINFKPWQFHHLVVARDTVQLKGSQTEDDPFNFGNFDTVVSFTSGLGVIPSGTLTSDIFKVYPIDSNLLYKNINNPLVGNTLEYFIDYYICNYNLEGQNYRIYGNGTFTQTSETAGTIKLISSFTGDAKVLWVNYTNMTLTPPTKALSGQGLLETYPTSFNCSRLGGYHLNATFKGFYAAYELFNTYKDLTYDSEYQNYANALKYSVIDALNIDNSSYIYKKESYSNALKQPGFVLAANGLRDLTGLVTVSRDTVAGHENQLKAIATSSVTQIKLENLINRINFSDVTTLSIEAASSVETILTVTLSRSLDALNTTTDYQVQLLTPGNSTTITKAFTRKNFLQFNANTTIWNSLYNIVTPSVTGTGSVSNSKIQVVIDDWQPVVTQITFNKSALTDTAIAILTGAIFNNQQPKIVFASTGATKVKVKTATNAYFSFQLPNTSGNWVTLQIDISALINLVELSIESTDITPTTFQLFFIGSSPVTLPLGTVYKSSIADNYLGIHTLWIGDCKAINNSFETLQYSPGLAVVSKELFKLGNVFSKPKWYGKAAINNQSPYSLKQFGETPKLNNQLQFLSDAFDSYYASYGVSGLLKPEFTAGLWNNSSFADNQGVKIQGSDYYYQTDYFTASNTDPDFDNFTVVAKIVEDLAKYLQHNPGDEITKKIVTNFLIFINKYYLDENTNQPPTTIFNHTANYHNPENAALIGKIALYGNLSGVDAELTIDVIQACYNYLAGQYVDSSNSVTSMLGSWSKGQLNFVSNSVTYKEYSSTYHCQVIDFLASLLKNGNNLKYPYLYTPDTFPNITPDYIDNIKLPTFKNTVNKFTDNEQTILFSNTSVGLEMTFKYSLISATQLETLVNFWKDQGGKSGIFSLPFSIWKHPDILKIALNIDNLTFAFTDTLNFDVRVTDKLKGLWRLEFKIAQTVRVVYDKVKKANSVNSFAPYNFSKTPKYPDVDGAIYTVTLSFDLIINSNKDFSGSYLLDYTVRGGIQSIKLQDGGAVVTGTNADGTPLINYRGIGFPNEFYTENLSVISIVRNS